MFETVAAVPKRVPSPYPLADTWASRQNLVLPPWTMAWLQERLAVRRRYRWRMGFALLPAILIPIIVFVTDTSPSGLTGVLAIAATWGWMIGVAYLFERRYQRDDAAVAVLPGPRIARSTRLSVREVVGVDFLWTSVALASVGLLLGTLGLVERPADTPLLPMAASMIVVLTYSGMAPFIVRRARDRPSYGRDLIELAVDDRLRSVVVRDRLAPIQPVSFLLFTSGVATLAKLGDLGTALGAAVLGLYVLSIVATFRWTWSRPMVDVIRGWYGWPALRGAAVRVSRLMKR